MKGLFAFFAFLIFAADGQSQIVTGLTTAWSDSFREWVIYTEDENEEGELRQRWTNSDNWTEWEFRIGDLSGHIRQKWPNDPNAWELWTGNETIAARTVWPNDFREWRISWRGKQLTFKSRFSNILEEWELRGNNEEQFSVYTRFEGDPREWLIEDELDDSHPFGVRLMMAFLAVYHATPKN